jgi:hypothetical protein
VELNVKEERKMKKSNGLGDTVAKVTAATGIQSLVKKVTNGDCGCNNRRKKLNDLFPCAK